MLLAGALATGLGCNAKKDSAGDASSKTAEPVKSATGSSDAKKDDAKTAEAKTDDAKPQWTAELAPKVEAIKCDGTAVGKRLALPPGGRMQEMTHDARSVFWSMQHEDAQYSWTLHGVNRDGTDAHQLAKLEQELLSLAVWQDDVFALGKAGKLFSIPRKGGEPKVLLEGNLGGLAVHRGAALVIRDAGDDVELVRVEGGAPTVVATWRGDKKVLAVAGDVAYAASAEGVSSIDLATKKVTPIPLTLADKPLPPIDGIKATATHLMVWIAKDDGFYKGGVAPIAGGALTPFDGHDPTLNASSFFFVKPTPLGGMDWGPDQVMRQKLGEPKPQSIRSVKEGAGALSADDECIFVGAGIPGAMATVTAVAAGG